MKLSASQCVDLGLLLVRVSEVWSGGFAKVAMARSLSLSFFHGF